MFNVHTNIADRISWLIFVYKKKYSLLKIKKKFVYIPSFFIKIPGYRLTRSIKHADRRKIIKRSFFPEGGYLIVKHPYAKKFQYPKSIKDFNKTNVDIQSHDSRMKRNNLSPNNITFCCHHPTDLHCKIFTCI